MKEYFDEWNMLRLPIASIVFSLCIFLLPLPAFATTVYLTSGTSWTVPSDWSSTNTIEVIGGGGGGGAADNNYQAGGGGGGGAYSKVTNLSGLSGSITYSIGTAGTAGSTNGANGTAGGDTWFNGASLAASSVGAKGGGAGDGGATSCLTSAGGAAASGVGTTKYSGGGGGAGACGNEYSSGGGGGGAAGLNGAGVAGATVLTDYNDGPGGAGGAGDNGSGGAGGGSDTAGSAGTEWDATHGSGGGGGGGTDNAGIAGPGAVGGLYGAGGGGGASEGNSYLFEAGGAGKQGLIVITYTPTPSPSCSSTYSQAATTEANSGTFVTYASGVANATSVSFPTWSDVGGQDDIVWYTGVNDGGGVWHANINLATHLGAGTVNVHVYMYNAAYSNVFCGASGSFTRNTNPPTPNPATFSSAPAPASASSVSMTATTATDADGSTPVAYSFAFSACGVNGGTGGTSSGWQASASYTNSTLQPNQCYGYTIQTRDSIPNTGTASAQNTTYTFANVPSAPTLASPSYTTMVLTNNENGNPLANPATLFAAYVTSADANWNGKYVDSAGNASATAVWLTDAQLTSLTINGMTAGTSYTVAVKARNNNNVETAFGTGATLSTLNDVTAPTPNPSTFSTAPAPDSASQVSMIASTATDAQGSTPVNYIFNFSACGANGGTGGTSSGWQASASYSDAGLQPNQCYGYTTQSRDSITNTTAASGQSTTYTLANVPSAPTLSSATAHTMVITNNENGNPLATPATLFAAQVTTTDATWSGKYIDSSGNPSAVAVWLTDAQLTSLTLNSMALSTSYTIAVKARNNNNVETAFGMGATLSTTADTTAPAPNPSTFSTAPAPDSSSQVSMTASTATDADSVPVNYIFNFSACGANGGTGGTSSGWQLGTSYSDAGLQPNQCYGYTTQSKDSVGNITTASAQSTTYTLANAPGTPALVQPSQTTLQITNNQNSNPSASPATKYAAQIIAASDATWNNKYTNASGDPSATAVWLTNAQLNNLVISGLTAGVTYQVQVKARNENSIETAFSITGSNTTSATVDTTARYLRLRGVRLRGVRLIYAPDIQIFAAALRRPDWADTI